MAAAQITPTSILSVVNGNADVYLLEVNKITTDDWIELDFPALFAWFITEAGVSETSRYATGKVNDAATVLAADTTITFDGATVAQWPATGTAFYIKMGTEIMEVASYTATVMTVRRAAMGTTAAIHADDADFYVLNSIILDGADVGKCHGIAVTKAVS